MKQLYQRQNIRKKIKQEKLLQVSIYIKLGIQYPCGQVATRTRTTTTKTTNLKRPFFDLFLINFVFYETIFVAAFISFLMLLQIVNWHLLCFLVCKN